MPVTEIRGPRFLVSEAEAVLVIKRALGELALEAGIAALPRDDARRAAWYQMFHGVEAYVGAIPCVLCGAEERVYLGEQTRCANCGSVLRVS